MFSTRKNPFLFYAWIEDSRNLIMRLNRPHKAPLSVLKVDDLYVQVLGKPSWSSDEENEAESDGVDR